MSANVNREMEALSRAWKFEPLYSKCPECGCDLKKLPEEFAVLPDTFNELLILKRQNRTRMEKIISIGRKRMSLRIKRFVQRLEDRCLNTWK